MGLFSRKPLDPEVTTSVDDSLDIWGEEQHQDALRSITGGKECHFLNATADFPVLIELPRDQKNKANVQCFVDGQLIGYINPQAAPDLQDTLIQCERTGQHANLEGYIVGGYQLGDGTMASYGVKILN